MENIKNIVYIDESGILSKTGHSVYICLYVDYLNNTILSQKILDIENELRISYLHWVDMPWKLRFKFAQNACSLDFFCKVVIYDNPINQKIILVDFLSKVICFKESVYKIIIDGKKGKGYEQKFKILLKNKGVKFFKVKFIDDKKDPLIRLADFMVGMFRSFLDNKDKNTVYLFNILKDKIKIPD